MFFLLSRYQQLRELARMPHPIVSDYMFAKDTLFAHQTIRGDELTMYERVYAALSETTAQPNLVIFLRADTDTLMNRIAVRDRPYERNMDEGYIDGLRIAYEHFFTNYDPERLLRIDSNHVDFVHNEDDRRDILQRIMSRLGHAPQQPALPGLESPQTGVYDTATLAAVAAQAEPEPVHQQDSTADLLMNVMRLQEELGDLSKAIRTGWMAGGSEKDRLRDELSDVFASLFSIAGAVGVNLETGDLERLAGLNR
jgi:deoxyguanosine kinase